MAPSVSSEEANYSYPYPSPYPYPYPAPEGLSSKDILGGGEAYAPPELVNPKKIVLSNERPTYRGKGDEDVLIVVSEKITRPAKVSNVRNLVVIGGEFTINDPLKPDEPNTREAISDHRALAFSDITGTLYVEGIHINNSGGGLTEGLQIWNTAGRVIIRNSRIEGVRTKPGDTEFAFNHPDLLQPMSGDILLENVTIADSDFQGMFIGAEPGQTISGVQFRNVNTRAIRRQAWFFNNLDAGVVRSCENCWHDSLGSNRPNDYAYSFYPRPEVSESGVVWSNEEGLVFGLTINRGIPLGGDFAPAERVGMAYDPGFFAN